MTQTVFDHLATLEGSPSVAGLGGEQTIYASAESLVHDTRVVEVAVALCGEWATLEDRDTAAALLISAASTTPVLGAGGLYDVLLRSEAALPQLAPGLEGAFQARAGTTRGLERDTALEGWTRLALGNWARKTLLLRAMLQQGSEAPDATAPLVRALGAACSIWDDTELPAALTVLATHDSLDSDAAMELGFQRVASAAANTEVGAVRVELDDALRWFDIAYHDDARLDAAAFRAVVTGVAEQVSGHTIAAERFDAIADAVYVYLEGYRGAERGWRGARSGTTSAWLDLLTQLRAAESDGWFDTGTTLRALAHALAAEQTMVLVVNPGRTEPLPQIGVRELVWPRVEELSRGNEAVITHVKRWLATSDEPAESETRAAVVGLLARLEESPPKKAHSESVRLPDPIRENLQLTDEAYSALEDAAAAAPSLIPVLEQIARRVPVLNIAQQDLLERLLGLCDEYAEGGIGSYRIELTVLLTDVIRYVAWYLNLSQSPSRRPPWIVHKQPWPAEHVLADHMNAHLRAAGRESVVELPNVAGGRVDIAVTFQGRCTIFMEVKTVDQDRTEEQLASDFGTQAAQYAVTDIPVAILVVADYVPRKVRRDMTGAFHVAPMKLDPTSRQHALVTVRLQANVEPPSATSAKRISRKKPVAPSTD